MNPRCPTSWGSNTPCCNQVIAFSGFPHEFPDGILKKLARKSMICFNGALPLNYHEWIQKLKKHAANQVQYFQACVAQGCVGQHRMSSANKFTFQHHCPKFAISAILPILIVKGSLNEKLPSSGV